MVQECGFCGRTLVDHTHGLQLLPSDSRFSNIEEVDAEYDADESIDNPDEKPQQQPVSRLANNGSTETVHPQEKMLEHLVIRDPNESEINYFKDRVAEIVDEMLA